MEKEQFIKEVVPLRDRLLACALHYLREEEEAEDVTQEVYLKLWSIRHMLDEYDSVPALSVQITKNLSLNRIKVRQREQYGNGNVVNITDMVTPLTRMEESDSINHVMRIIDQLPDLQQTILKMKHVDGLDIEEIAELTGCKSGAIRMNLSRARKRVREIFFKMQNDDRNR